MRFITCFILLIIISCAHTPYTPKELAFTKIFIVPFEPDSNDQEDKELAKLSRQEVFDELKMHKQYALVPLKESDNFLKEFKEIADDDNKKIVDEIINKTQSDTFLVGSLTSKSIKLELISANSKRSIFFHQVKAKDSFTKYTVKSITSLALKKLLSFVPYDAVVLKSKNGKIRVNVGSTTNQLKDGKPVTIFEISDIKKDGEDYIVTKHTIAEAVLVKVKEDFSIGEIVKTKPHKNVEDFNKVSLINFYTE